MPPWCLRLLEWYYHARREMPWRGHPDAYAVWVSEIMLQQTQVNTVRPYFERFLQLFPDVFALASATDEALLKAWEGLGYYTRVRNLRKAAQQLVAENEGRLPQTARELKNLPGIGAYTAAAIASICFNECEPVVDGNVARVFARRNLLSDDFSKEAPRRSLANWLRPFISACAAPGDFNQAMMELGALICTPRHPVCPQCPLRSECKAAETMRQEDYPVALKRKALPERKHEVLLLRNAKGELLLTQHQGERLLDGFWELPRRDLLSFPIRRLQKCYIHKQTFSHFRQILTVFTAELPAELPLLPPDFQWCAAPEKLPITTATRKILMQMQSPHLQNHLTERSSGSKTSRAAKKRKSTR